MDLYGRWEALDWWKWVVFDAGVTLDTLATHSENYFLDTWGSWVGDHAARPQGAIRTLTLCDILLYFFAGLAALARLANVASLSLACLACGCLGLAWLEGPRAGSALLGLAGFNIQKYLLILHYRSILVNSCYASISSNCNNHWASTFSRN